MCSGLSDSGPTTQTFFILVLSSGSSLAPLPGERLAGASFLSSTMPLGGEGLCQARTAPNFFRPMHTPPRAAAAVVPPQLPRTHPCGRPP
jgi:hypothetical protein